MFIRIGFDIAYSFPQPTEMIMMLYTHPSRSSFLMKPERLISEPALMLEDFIDVYGNKCARAFCQGGTLHLKIDTVMKDDGLPDILTPDARQHGIRELPTDTLLYLLGSRYCEIEKLTEAAWDLFGQGSTGWGRVQAICDWVHNHITFAHESARCDRTAYDTFLDQRGVCRDYTHLAITFCRCMGIPARYATGYLGDIQVPLLPPMDFSAWFEVFLGGKWHTFDARNNQPRVGRILMARGRDAADVALTTTFGKHALEKFDIWADEISESELEEVLAVR
ncbi:transglutaminase family protein [Candidatus Methylospira mobilis]|uniref:Transglutaminase family protein n=1 Tax=Candidatus Methylospira mobilis TaxID=1808979 RepID=A0A5Q0BN13_9GAMM|nr:transglutaminase family protein [Candidatus Methylospira mobilis]QFY44532.1 transglutaminase family protein [Candidatus Methylospira mobilis]WNV06037.1 transglutaminase family protein [Candidatus Methylospira mobilis]